MKKAKKVLSMEHLRFLEHMLLEEHVADRGRGNSCIAAVKGFRAFWPHAMPVCLLKNQAVTLSDADLLLQLDRALLTDASAVLASWESEIKGRIGPEQEKYPLLSFAGPFDHATAFLVTKESDEVVCYYANTGRGRQDCGDGTIKTTCKWRGTSIIPFIELGRRTIMDEEGFSIYVGFLTTRVPGFDATCPLWTPLVHDRMLTLAQYAKHDGAIRSFPQRGGTCTFNCVIWLVGGVMLDQRDAVEAEKKMKCNGLRALAELRPAYSDRQTRALMEAAAYAYTGVEWCVDETASLRAAVEASFGAEMGSPLCEYMIPVQSARRPAVKFSLDPSSFPDIESAGKWCVQARKWVKRATRRTPTANEPVYLLFLYKARRVLCIDAAEEAGSTAAPPRGSIVAVAQFLAMCRGVIQDDTAIGMMIRVVRIAVSLLTRRRGAITNHRRLVAPKKHAALPWVVEEYRALAADKRLNSMFTMLIDAKGKEIGAVDPSARDEFESHGVSFQKGGLTHREWSWFLERMRDPSAAALNIVMLLMYTMTEETCPERFELFTEGTDLCYSDGSHLVPIRFSETAKRDATVERAYSSYDMRAYLRLSTEDVGLSARLHSGPALPRMAIELTERNGETQDDLPALVQWAERERAAWEGDHFRAMAKHRSLEYCAAKFLEPASRAMPALGNLETLIASAAHWQAPMRYEVLRGKASEAIDRLFGAGDAPLVRVPLVALEMTSKNGAETVEPGGRMLRVVQPGRRLVFSCTGGAMGAVRDALVEAFVRCVHWDYGDRHEIEACGAKIVFPVDGSATASVSVTDSVSVAASEYIVEFGPSEWSSLWYTTVSAMVLPVRRGSSRALAVFVSDHLTQAVPEGAPYFENTRKSRTIPHPSVRGTHFVVPFDSVGLLPACSPLEAHTLLCAYSHGAPCAIRLMPIVAAFRPALEKCGLSVTAAAAAVSCINARYAAWALGMSTGAFPRLEARVPEGTNVTAWCAQRLQPSFGSWDRAAPAGLPALPALPALEEMRESCRRKFRYWYGTVPYGPDERAAAYVAASLDAAQKDAGLRAHMSPDRLATYECDPVRGAFEAATGRFLSKAQAELVSELRSARRATRQMNMGFGKSTVVLPLLVLAFLASYHTVIVTQPEHLVAAALRVIGTAVASRRITGYRVVVTGDARRAVRGDDGTRYVVVCSGADMQRALPSIVGSMYSGQHNRAHIADEIDETSDPLTCEQAVTTGVPMPHYDPSVSAIAYHRAVCDVVLGEDTGEDQAPWRQRLRDIASIAKSKRVDVDFGLVDTEGVYLAVPHRFVMQPVHGTVYTDPDVGAVLTAIAVYAACERLTLSSCAKVALERALVALSLDARDVMAKVRSHPQSTRALFLLHSILVALPQVVYYKRERVTSFMDLLGTSDGFVAFSGTIALALPVPVTTDERRSFMPPVQNGSLLAVRDEAGNVLVRSILARAGVESVPGVYGPDRAAAVVALLDGRLAMTEGQFVVVDASGELGIIAAPLLRDARGFVDGVLSRGTQRVVYYDHKNSRGTDAELDARAAGYVVIDWERSTLTQATQAMYRLRGVEYGQTVTFVVCGTERTPSTEELLAKLQENELARIQSATERAALQKQRAELPKTGRDSFEYDAQLGRVDATQRQQQHQATESVCLRTRDAGAISSHDPHVLYDLHEYKPESKLLGPLFSADIRVSPLLVYGDVRLEHAFVVIGRVVSLCALVEIWAVRKDHAHLRKSEFSAYTHEGELLRGEPAPRGLVLFGRYLCGATLPLDEQRELMLLLSTRYATGSGRNSLRSVVRCLRETGFLGSHADPVFSFIVQDIWDAASFVPPELGFVHEVTSTKRRKIAGFV